MRGIISISTHDACKPCLVSPDQYSARHAKLIIPTPSQTSIPPDKRKLILRVTLLLLLLLLAIWLFNVGRLLELGLVFGKRDFQPTPSIRLALVVLHKVLGRLELAETNRDDALGLPVIQRTVRHLAVLCACLTEVLLDVQDSFIVLLKFLQREDVLDNSNLGPLVLLGRKCLGNFFFIVRPLVEFTIPLLATIRALDSTSHSPVQLLAVTFRCFPVLTG